MKSLGLKSALLGICGLATACGSYTGNVDELLTELSDENTSADDQHADAEDESRFALSLPIAEKNPVGVIVAKKTISVERAQKVSLGIQPPRPALKCVLHAASHLVKLSAGEKSSSFTATVTYPKGLKFALTRSSCQEGQLVNVRTGMGFKGTAITQNKDGVAFQMANFVSIPKPVLCDEKFPEKCAAIPVPVVSCSVFGGRSNISLQDNPKKSEFLGTVIRASGPMDAMFRKNECENGARLIADSKSLQSVLSVAVAQPEPKPEPKPPLPCGDGVVTNCLPEWPIRPTGPMAYEAVTK